MTQNALTKTGPSAVALPDFVKPGDLRGTENIDRGEILLPRLSLAQALSPELDASDPKYIEGLKNGEAFNSVTREIYGKDPIDVVILKAERPRYIEFDPKQRGVIVDFDVPANDPRTQFTEKDGQRIKPVATKFLEFVAVVDGQPIVLSFKGAGLKTARTLSTLLALRRGPTFSAVYTLTPTVVKNDKGSFSIFTAKFKGNVDEETYNTAAESYEALKDRVVVTERETDDESAADAKVPF